MKHFTVVSLPLCEDSLTFEFKINTVTARMFIRVIFAFLLLCNYVLLRPEYRMRSNYSRTKLSRMEDFTIFAVFIFADAQVPNIIFAVAIDPVTGLPFLAIDPAVSHVQGKYHKHQSDHRQVVWR